MTPKYFIFAPWDDRPDGSFECTSAHQATAVFRSNQSKWHDVIRGKEAGMFFSKRLAENILYDRIALPDELSECHPAVPGVTESPETFPGYFLWIPSRVWVIRTEAFRWDNGSKTVPRWLPDDKPPIPILGRLKDATTGALGPGVCAIDLVLLARRIGASNFRFRPIETPNFTSVFTPPFRIDYLGKQWPPQWYPDGLEPHPSNLMDDVPADPLKKGISKN